MDYFALEIVTPEGRLTAADVELVEIPGVGGELGVYAGHTPFLTALGTGELRVYRPAEMTTYIVSGGYVEVRPDHMRVLAAFASAGEESTHIDEACERAKQSLERAQQEPPDVIKGEVEALKNELVKKAEAHRFKRASHGKS